jgi:pimeloyl-ACP methyl ester carboxylesterase
VATFVLIHGAWHDASCWDPVVACLRELGHTAVAPDLPTDDPRAGYEQRAEPAVAALASVSGPAEIVGHSAGSAEAAIAAAARPDALLAYLCPRFGFFAVPDDAPPVFRPAFSFPPPRPDGTSSWDRDAAIATMYPRLPAATQQRLASRLRPEASAASPYPLAAHPPVATSLIYTTDDEFFDPGWPRYIARELLRIDPIELPGGHFPMLEDPAGLARVLATIAPAP